MGLALLFFTPLSGPALAEARLLVVRGGVVLVLDVEGTGPGLPFPPVVRFIGVGELVSFWAF